MPSAAGEMDAICGTAFDEGAEYGTFGVKDATNYFIGIGTTGCLKKNAS